MREILDKKIYLELYQKMLLIRLTEEAIAEKYHEEKMRCPTHLCIGQEAVSAGVSLALNQDDQAVSSHRAHGHYLAKGGNLKTFLAELYGKETGCSKGLGGSMHLVDQTVGFMGSTAIVAGTIPVGVGLGLSFKLQKNNKVACIYLGDGATEEGVFYESINFAILKKLPVIFVCENNLYSVYSPLKVRQPKNRKIHKMVEALGCKVDYGNGNRADEVYSKVRNIIDSVRQGDGPFFFEFDTYRWLEHCGPNYDNDLGYRTKEEFLEWKKRDPIKLFRDFLLDNKFVNAHDFLDMEKEINSHIKEAFFFAENSPAPKKLYDSQLYK